MAQVCRTILLTFTSQRCRRGLFSLAAGAFLVAGNSGMCRAGAVPDSVGGRVAAYLAAGEFGAAMAAAAGEADPVQRTALIQGIADAQRVAGEAATASSQFKQSGRVDLAMRGSLSGQSGFGGGGTQANFGPLMQIIQQNTSGKWSQQDGDGGSMTPYFQGVKVAPNGLLHRLTSEEQNGNLAALGVQARKADLNSDVAVRSSLRLVSLTRLERRVAQRLAEGLSIPETMAQLAGLSQVRYLIVAPETHEIIIGGPAEAWEYNSLGQAVGATSHRPTLQLDDLVTVLRAFARPNADFGCSINTREEGIRALKEFAEKSQSRGPINSVSVRNWVNQLQAKLGRQDIEIWGVPGDSHVARVIVEADYRMKLVGIDKLDAGKEIPSYFDLLAATQPKNAESMAALRWWLTMKYEAVAHSSDKSVFEILGSSVLCQSENQFLTAEGKHLPTGQAELTNRLFAENFTNHYDKLAARDLVFAEMQNVFDLALVAALIHHEKLQDQAGWNMGVFLPQGDYISARYPVPKEIDSVANHKVYNGRDIVVQVAGGVRADVMSVVKNHKLNVESPRLGNIAQSAKVTELPEGRWWWDSLRERE